MKPVIRKNVAGNRIDAALPPTLRGRLPATAATPEAHYALVLFPHDTDDVTHSSAVVKALAKIAPGTAVIAAGFNFTEEARAVLRDRGALLLSRSDFPWTDEGHRTLRERMAALRGK